MDNLKDKKIITIIICIIVLIGVGVFLYFSQSSYGNEDSIDILDAMEEEMFSENETNDISEAEMNEIIQGNIVQNEIIEEIEKIAIHITGEVNKTGIIYLEKGARIADAIDEAGGATKNANLDQVNLAYVLEDGQKIYIPNKKEKLEAREYIIENSGNNVLVENGKSSTNSSKGVGGKVNINSANQTELETLPGIGPSLAQRIIEYREVNGEFERIEDLQNIKGIGDSKYSNIKEKICI